MTISRKERLNRKYPCPLCEVEFKGVYSFIAHLNIHHEEFYMFLLAMLNHIGDFGEVCLLRETMQEELNEQEREDEEDD